MKNNRFKLNIQLFALGADGPMAYDPTIGAEYDLESATAAYTYLTGMSESIATTVSSLSNLPSATGIDVDGKYGQSLECIKGLNGQSGLGTSLSDARGRAKNVVREILVHQGFNGYEIDSYFKKLDGAATSSEFADALAEGTILGMINSISELGGGTPASIIAELIIGAAYSIGVSMNEGSDDWVGDLGSRVGKTLAGLINFSEMKKIGPIVKTVFGKYGLVAEIGLDLLFTLGPSAGAAAIQRKKLTGQDFLEMTAFSVVSNVVGAATHSAFLGSMAGNLASTYCTKPFVEEDGTVNNGWCTAAGAATLVGVGLGVAAVATGVVAAPVLAAVGVGAAVGYAAVAVTKGITNWIRRSREKRGNP